jgi:cysteine synthase A
MTMGVATALAEAGSPARIVIFEPASTAVITGGEPGRHRVEGIGIGYIPPLLDPASPVRKGCSPASPAG